jgi:hypothetical protein
MQLNTIKNAQRVTLEGPCSFFKCADVIQSNHLRILNFFLKKIGNIFTVYKSNRNRQQTFKHVVNKEKLKIKKHIYKSRIVFEALF